MHEWRDGKHGIIRFVPTVNFNNICCDLQQDGSILLINGIMLLLFIYL